MKGVIGLRLAVFWLLLNQSHVAEGAAVSGWHSKLHQLDVATIALLSLLRPAPAAENASVRDQLGLT